MPIRRAVYRWLLPAAIVLPAWLLTGWIIFSGNGWALLPVLLVFIPSVFIAEIVFALLIRSRPSVARDRAVSWQDVGVIAIWHLLTIGVGFFYDPLFAVTLILAIIGAAVVLGSSLKQLWSDTLRLRSPGSSSPDGGAQPFQKAAPEEIIVIREHPAEDRPSH